MNLIQFHPKRITICDDKNSKMNNLNYLGTERHFCKFVFAHQRAINVETMLKMKVEPTYVYWCSFNIEMSLLLVPTLMYGYFNFTLVTKSHVVSTFALNQKWQDDISLKLMHSPRCFKSFLFYFFAFLVCFFYSSCSIAYRRTAASILPEKMVFVIKCWFFLWNTAI